MQQEITVALVFLFLGGIGGCALTYWFLHRTGIATGNVQTAVNEAVNSALADVHTKLNKLLSNQNTPAPPVAPA